MSYVPRRLNPEQAEAARRFMRWMKGKTAAQIRAHYLKGAPSGGTVCAELAMYVAENGRLKARVADETRKRRLAERVAGNIGRNDWDAAIDCCIETMARFGGCDGGTRKLLEELKVRRPLRRRNP